MWEYNVLCHSMDVKIPWLIFVLIRITRLDFSNVLKLKLLKNANEFIYLKLKELLDVILM